METRIMTDALVSTAWLAQHLTDPGLRLIEASYFVPGGIEKARGLYAESHIPGAAFFDINVFADTSQAKDHTFPTAAIFAARAGELGLKNTDRIVAYDRLGGTCAAARAWFMFRAFGHENVAVLDGGFAKWEAEQRPATRDVPAFAPSIFKASDPSDWLTNKAEILANTAVPTFQLLDARSRGRFEGTEPEPRAGLRSGHIPGSCSLPSASMLNPDKTWKDPAALRATFAEAGIDLAKPLTTTCGSGVTACALAFGAYLTGKHDTVIYDGSWMDWGADPAVPVATGP
jgi:thiosulfate/3-mercaptopyruvate sulfurtransferase